MNNEVVATIGQKTFSINASGDNRAVIDGSSYSYSFVLIKDDKYSLILNGRCYEVIASLPNNEPPTGKGEIVISLNGKIRAVQLDDARTYRLKSLFARSTAKSHHQTVRAPMPGIIARLEVSVGDEVVPGRGLLVLEAMKMENEIRSTTRGKVTRIFVDKGKIVEKGESLVIISSE